MEDNRKHWILGRDYSKLTVLTSIIMFQPSEMNAYQAKELQCICGQAQTTEPGIMALHRIDDRSSLNNALNGFLETQPMLFVRI